MSSSSLPLPPPGGHSRRISSGGGSGGGGSLSSSSSSVGGYRRSSSASLPPPPNVTPTKQLSSSSSISNSALSPKQQQMSTMQQTNYAQTLARSMTIEEMRALHRKALADAESKQTELRLVLASRYKELVGSSDEVTKMNERARELHQLVTALPHLMEKLIRTAKQPSSGSVSLPVEDDVDGGDGDGNGHDGETKSSVPPAVDKDCAAVEVLKLRQQLSMLPRLIHRALDMNDVHKATKSLMELFQLIAQQTDEYPLATALSSSSPSTTRTMAVPKQQQEEEQDVLLQAQMRMTYLHVQTLPAKIIRNSKQILDSAASFSVDEDGGRDGSATTVTASTRDPMYGAETSAAALSALDLLAIRQHPTPTGGHHASEDRSVELLDLYFDSKARLLQSLLSQLHTNSSSSSNATPAAGTATTKDQPKSASATTNSNESDDNNTTNNAEEILSKIVLILQYDIVLHPYQIFVLRDFPSIIDDNGGGASSIMISLPMFPGPVVQAKVSNFLSAHLPLIRTKVKSVLVEIAGTTASALGKIRQSLYDKTDGVECMERLDSNGICTWDEAVSAVVDVQSVLNSSHVGVGNSPMGFVDSAATAVGSSSRDRKFSLWGVLFSNTFSSLVHSLLTSSFQSVHTKVVSTLRLSLTNAPPLSSILPHEAYRNTLHIASELDTALLKVSDDAHELLVHAEERVESERRLRQSLYVQTCEIMGRLICELRRMLLLADHFDAVKQLIVGRLCHLLKFRLTALPTLLDPSSSPAILHGTTGMISLMELSSAFDLADDNDDGLITFQEAMEAVDSAFSGTQFHGAEMVRETLLLPTAGDKDTSLKVSAEASTPQDVTLDELTLLLARGLRHERSGEHSALGTIQNSLDSMITSCFDRWAKEALQPSASSLSEHVKNFVKMSCTSSEDEYQRMYNASEMGSSMAPSNSPVVSNVSPHVISFLVDISFTLNRSVCPSDSILPVPSNEYAIAMGIVDSEIPRMIDVIRWALLTQGVEAVASIAKEHIEPALNGTGSLAMKDSGPSAIAQLKNDLSFLQTCFFDRNHHGFGKCQTPEAARNDIQRLMKSTDVLVRRVCDMNTLREIEEKQKYVMEVCDLFFSSLFGEDSAAVVPLGDLGGSIGATPRTGATLLFHPPLASSCRFPLLPIQADRTLSGVQARGKYKEKDEVDSRSDNVGGGAVRAGFGFFSNMLKKGG